MKKKKKKKRKKKRKELQKIGNNKWALMQIQRSMKIRISYNYVLF